MIEHITVPFEERKKLKWALPLPIPYQLSHFLSLRLFLSLLPLPPPSCTIEDKAESQSSPGAKFPSTCGARILNFENSEWRMPSSFSNAL